MPDNYHVFADALAGADAIEQAAFFNRFAHTTRVSANSNYNRETWCHQVVEHLDGSSYELFDMFVGCIKAHKEAMEQRRVSISVSYSEIKYLKDRKRDLEKQIIQLESDRLNISHTTKG